MIIAGIIFLCNLATNPYIYVQKDNVYQVYQCILRRTFQKKEKKFKLEKYHKTKYIIRQKNKISMISEF